jgi:hypothetical protein
VCWKVRKDTDNNNKKGGEAGEKHLRIETPEN